MAAVIQPHHLPSAPQRPELRLIPGGRSEPAVRRPGPAPLAVAAALVLTLLVVVGAVAVGRGVFGGLAPAPPAAASAPAAEAGARTVVVQPGDTLWSIARDLQPSGDVRSLVDELRAANGSGPLVIGERLVVPA